MDAVTLALAKNHTNEQVIQKATNSPTETISFDCGAYSLPSTVVYGQVSDVVVKGLTATNIIKNGSFADGMLGWGFTTSAPVIVDGRAYFNREAGGALVSLSQSVFDMNNKYYASFDLDKIIDNADKAYGFGTTVSIRIDFRNAPIGRSKQSILFQPDGTTAYFNTNIGGTEYYIDNVLIVDLTATFGAGNEPTKEQCDAMFPYWFDGTKSTVSAMRIKSIGKNIINLDEAKPRTKVNSIQFYDDRIVVYPSGLDCAIRMPFYMEAGKVYRGKRLPRGSMFFGSSTLFVDNRNQISNISSGLLIPLINIKGVATWFLDNREDLTPITIYKEDVMIALGTTVPEYEPYTESIQYLPNVGELRSLPNGVKDEVNVTTGVKTQRNGTKTNVNSGTVIDYADMATGGQFVAYAADGTSQVGVKGDTLTITAVSLTYQLATPIVTKLPAQAPLQVFENGTVYVEPLGDPSETTLPSVEMTIPTGTSNKFGVATHNYGGAAADWVLSNSESKCFLLAVSNAGGAANIIAPDAPGVMYAISNASGHTITIKISGGTGGVAITNAKTVLVIHNGTDYTALTAELEL